jgi:hypothetical protein
MREKKIVSADKVMLTIFWSLAGIHMINRLPKGE